MEKKLFLKWPTLGQDAIS